MPEGDTVWLTAHRLHERLSGRVLVRAELRVPAHATAELTGRTVLETLSRGKHLLTRISGGLTLHTHLKMDGSWRFVAAGADRLPGPAHQVRAVLGTPSAVAVGLRLGLVQLLPTREEASVLGGLGPDLLAEQFDEAEAVRRIAAQPARAVGAALIDQRNVAGVGTLYRAETLFLAGIDPRTPVGKLTDLGRPLRLARRLLMANRERWEQITTGDRADPLWVFGRRICRRCSGRVSFTTLDGRNTYWCANCQPPAE